MKPEPNRNKNHLNYFEETPLPNNSQFQNQGISNPQMVGQDPMMMDPQKFLSSMMQSDAFIKNMMKMFGEHYLQQNQTEPNLHQSQLQSQSFLNESIVSERQRDYSLNRQPEINYHGQRNEEYPIYNSGMQSRTKFQPHSQIDPLKTLDYEQGQGIGGKAFLQGQRRGFTPLIDKNSEMNYDNDDDIVLPGKSDFLNLNQNEFLQESSIKSQFNLASRPNVISNKSQTKYSDFDEHRSPSKNIKESNHSPKILFESEEKQSPNINFSKNHSPIRDFPQNNWDDQPIKPMTNNFQEDDFETTNNFNPHDEQPIKGAKNFEQLIEEKLGDQYPIVDGKKSQAQPCAQKKQFLKRGTRKFLSSANDKKTSKKPELRSNIPQINTNSDENEDIVSQKSKSKSRIEIKETDKYEIKEKPKKFLEKGKGPGGGGKGKPIQELKKEVIKYEDLLGLSNDESEESHGKYEKSDSAFDSGKKEKAYKAISYLDSSQDSKQREKFEFSSGKKDGNIFRQPERPLFDDQRSLESEEDEDEIEKEYKKKLEEKSQLNIVSPKKSKIVERYFGAGKRDSKSSQNDKLAGSKKRSTSSINMKKEVEVEITQEKEEEIVRNYVNDKIESLNGEIAKFKMENERVKKVRLKYEGLLRDLNKEMELFKKKRVQENEEFEAMKAEEMKKIRKEKKIFEKQSKLTTNTPNKKEREEIENLKKQITKMEEDQRAKELKQKGNIDRLRRENEDLNRRCNEFKEELKILEKSRLESEMHSLSYSSSKNTKSVTKPKSSKPQTARYNNKSIDNPKEESLKDSIYDSDGDGNKNEKVNILNAPKTKISTEKPKSKDFKKKEKNKSSNSEISTPRIGGSEEDDSKIGIRNLEELFPDYDFNYSSNEYYTDYIKTIKHPSKVKSQNVSSDGKIQRIYEDGKKEIVFQNGVKREAFTDGFTIVHFTNGDIKQTLPDGTVIYYFADAQTTQTTLQNGPNIYRFPNNQIEIHLENGGKEIKFIDGTEKFISPSGEESTYFVDGTVQKVTPDKIKIIKYTNGQKDTIHPDGTKTREFPDGRVRRYLPNSGV